MKTIAICNHKGGVGKTAASMALAEGLNAKGYRTLLVDLDQQTNATRQAGAKIEDAVTVYDLLTSFEYTAADGIQHYEHGDIIPGDTLVADAEVEMSKLDTPLTMLADALECVEGNYDYCVIDCPPSLELHEVGLNVALRLAGAGAADDAHVEVSVGFLVELGLLEGQTVFPGEQEVVRRVGLIPERQALLLAAPLGGSGLLAGTVVADEHNVAQPHKPNDGAQYEAVKQRHHVEVKVKRLCDEGLKAARHLAPQLHVEPEDDICADSVTKVEGDKRHDRRSKG